MCITTNKNITDLKSLAKKYIGLKIKDSHKTLVKNTRQKGG